MMHEDFSFLSYFCPAKNGVTAFCSLIYFMYLHILFVCLILLLFVIQVCILPPQGAERLHLERSSVSWTFE